MPNNRTISNECFIQAIATGETLHPQLLSNAPLSQSYNSAKGTFQPNWSGGGPIIYLSQLNGNQEVAPTGSWTWTYINQVLTFDSSGNCTTAGYEGLFKKRSYTQNGVTYTAALQIMGNLASANNIDLDTIGYSGKAELSGTLIDVDLVIPLKIAEWSGSGYFGQITFQDYTNSSAPIDGVKVITKKNQVLRATAHLYGDQELQSSQFYCKWYLNGTLLNSSNTSNVINISESQITDHAVLECRFYDNANCSASSLTTVVSEDIDDQQDPEFLYIQYQKYAYNQTNQAYAWGDWTYGKNVQLRKDQKCKYRVWVGKSDDASIDTAWTKFEVLFRGKGTSPLTSQQVSFLSGLTNSSGWYTLTKSENRGVTGEILYSEAAGQGDGLQMFVKAS